MEELKDGAERSSRINISRLRTHFRRYLLAFRHSTCSTLAVPSNAVTSGVLLEAILFWESFLFWIFGEFLMKIYTFLNWFPRLLSLSFIKIPRTNTILCAWLLLSNLSPFICLFSFSYMCISTEAHNTSKIKLYIWVSAGFYLFFY